MALSNIKKGSGNIAGLYVGSTEVSKAYLGTTLVYEKGSPGPHDYTNDYLTFVVVSSGTIMWKTEAYNTATPSDYFKTVSYRINGVSWESITSSTDGETISVNAGDVVEFKGNNSWYCYMGSGASAPMVYTGFQGGTATYNIQGNIMSLIGGDNFLSTTSITEPCALMGLFTNSSFNSGPLSAANLKLPATSISTMCYCSMFMVCTSLTEAPELSTASADNAYNSMFYGCISLVSVPTINVQSLDDYYGVFDSMFYGCTSLTSLTVASSDINNDDMRDILKYASPTGTIHCASNKVQTWTNARDVYSYIPSGWTIEAITE